ncbi:DUF3667 domain-containing protein [Zunongwangia sp. HRR-M8]|uniref:DUF3667 domain-containing protein n=1 Tax=Zunongwangia sp. HRR-M8 TaxID=3015170 RepID=UPI0022DCF6DA|nr:DUF3667 domain-containing protein [Zunongwangia sp. HRR-M8]WBL23531.1 DUF3667 domain-containing protein [Zunongwangia sp. HRR-M8]
MIICKNCHQHFQGNFCNRCGQKATVKRIHRGFIFNDLQLGLFNIDSGFFFTAKELFTRPGYAIKDYIVGKRVRYFMPVSLLILLSTIYSFLYHYLEIDVFYQATNKFNGDEKYLKLVETLDGNYVYYTLATLHVFTFSSWLVFRKTAYNFSEHFVLNTYAASQRLIFHTALLGVLYVIPEKPGVYQSITAVQLIVDVLLILWCNIQFFKLKPIIIIFKSILILILTFFILTFIISIFYHVL